LKPSSNSYAASVKVITPSSDSGFVSLAVGECGSGRIDIQNGITDYSWSIDHSGGSSNGSLAVTPSANDVLKIEVEDVSSGGGDYDIRFYINGNLEHEETSVTLPNHPSTRNSVGIGWGTSTLFGGTFDAFDDLLVEELTP
jgi:hypothetical protein